MAFYRGVCKVKTEVYVSGHGSADENGERGKYRNQNCYLLSL